MNVPQPRPWIDRIESYVPGKPASTIDGSMASNESTAGSTPAVVQAVTAALKDINRYPDPLAGELRSALATLHGVDADQILVSNGSDELVYLLVSTYAACGGRVLCARPAYRIDEVSAVSVGAEVEYAPLLDWRHDLTAMGEVPADVAFVVNPHNPTGTVCRLDEITRFVHTARARVAVVDEAYIDFAESPESFSAVPLARQGDAVVLRTFSKAFGLAGARVGYLIGSRDLVATLRKVRAPFSVSSLAQAAALAALGDRSHYEQLRNEVIDRRKELVRLLADRGYETVPSQANFVLVTFDGDADEEQELIAHLAGFGISVRSGSALGAPGTVRITVPSAEGLRRLDEALSPGGRGFASRR